MSWWKNGLLLGVGGIAGLALAAWLESDGKFDDDFFRVPRESKWDQTTAKSIKALMEKIRDYR